MRRHEISEQKATIETNIHHTVRQEGMKTELIGQLHHLTRVKLKHLAAQRDQIETIQTQLKRQLYSIWETIYLGETIEQVKILTSTLQPNFLEPKTEADMAFSAIEKRVTVGPSKCVLTYREGIEGSVVGKKSTVVLQTLKIDNQPCDVAVKSISCELESELSGARRMGQVEKLGQSQYKISYQPTRKGWHRLHIKVEGQHIKDSPFRVSVTSLPDTPVQVICEAQEPVAVAVSPRGEIVVADGSENCVIVFSSNGERLRSFGTRDYGPAHLNPKGVAVDREGNVFVADAVNHRVQKFTQHGYLLAQIGIASDRTNILYPRSIAFNASNGKLYVSNPHGIDILNSNLTHSHSFGRAGNDPGKLSYPEQIACSSTGDVYVSDYYNHCVQVFTANGQFLKAFGAEQLSLPYGIAVDLNGRVYVSEWGNSRVSVFTLDGQFVTSFGRWGSEPGQFRYPSGLAVDRNEIVYVCDRFNHLQLFDLYDSSALK